MSQQLVRVNPMTGQFKSDGTDDTLKFGGVDNTRSSWGTSVKFAYDNNNRVAAWTVVSYRERFEKKRQGLHDMVDDGDGFTREEVHDLILTAHKSLWQQSKDLNISSS